MSITIDQTGKIFKLDTAHTSYVFGVESQGDYLAHYYYGAKIRDLEACPGLLRNYDGASFAPWSARLTPDLSRSITMQECTTYGTGDNRIASVAVRTADAMEYTDPRYVSARVFKGRPEMTLPHARINEDPSVETLEVLLRDPFTNVEFQLDYTVFPEQDVIVRSMNVKNGGSEAVHLIRAMSMCLDLPDKSYDLVQTPGTYFRERWIERNPLHSGVQGYFSRRSSSGHSYNPVFALAASDATEASGDVYGAMLVYSGSFSVEIEVDAYRRTRAIAGINPDEFEWKLLPGTEFRTPEAFLTFSAEGLGGMSHNFHDMLRDHLIDPKWAHKERPILVNNWEATYFNFNREKLISIAKDAAQLGIEMLVLDDGWFGHRDNDRSSLGDWFVYRDKVGDLGSLVEEINKLGLKFGLWFEPEMISEDSELYRQHPEWVFTIPGKERSVGRNQFVLNMALPEVVDHLFHTISGVLKSANIEYIKWDMNRQPVEKYLPGYPADRQKEASHRYVLGVYELHRRLLEAFPDLFIEGCSGGGGRFDAGLLYYVPQIWTSDDTDAIERLKIQAGTSLFYPCSSHGAHVSVCPNHGTLRTTPFATRGHVALAGTFGYELDLNKMNEEDRQMVREQTKMYHKLHHLVTNGDFYRLTEAETAQAAAAWEFVAKDKSEALFLYVQPVNRVVDGCRILRFRGLDPERQYKIEETGAVFYGDTLMNAGIPMPQMWEDGLSVLYHLTGL